MAAQREVTRESITHQAPSLELFMQTQRRPLVLLPFLVVADAIGRLLPGVIMASVAIEASLLYRLWHQMMGTVPASGLGALLFSLTGTLIEPFRRYDTVRILPEAPVIDLAALIAVEVYLVAALALITVTAICRIAARPDTNFAVVALRCCNASLGAMSGLRRLYETLDRESWRLAEAFDAYVQSRNWANYKRAARKAYLAGIRLSREQGRSVRIAAQQAWRMTSDRRSWLGSHAYRVLGRLHRAASDSGEPAGRPATTVTRRQFLRLPSSRG